MDDLISRQAAIEAIEEYADRLQMVNWKENPNVPYKVHSLNWCINTIRDLPSIDAVPTWFHDKCMQEEIKKRFGMEEVVHCKDCAWHTSYNECTHRHWDVSQETQYPVVYEDDFCSYGERREE